VAKPVGLPHPKPMMAESGIFFNSSGEYPMASACFRAVTPLQLQQVWPFWAIWPYLFFTKFFNFFSLVFWAVIFIAHLYSFKNQHFANLSSILSILKVFPNARIFCIRSIHHAVWRGTVIEAFGF